MSMNQGSSGSGMDLGPLLRILDENIAAVSRLAEHEENSELLLEKLGGIRLALDECADQQVIRDLDLLRQALPYIHDAFVEGLRTVRWVKGMTREIQLVLADHDSKIGLLEVASEIQQAAERLCACGRGMLHSVDSASTAILALESHDQAPVLMPRSVQRRIQR